MNENNESEDSEKNQEKTGPNTPEEDSEKESTKGERISVASGSVGPKRIFKGKLDDAMKMPMVSCAFSILVNIFGGHYITSNTAEACFTLKPALKSHRTVKNGKAFIQLAIFLRSKLKKKNRKDIKSFFRNEVITFDRL